MLKKLKNTVIGGLASIVLASCGSQTTRDTDAITQEFIANYTPSESQLAQYQQFQLQRLAALLENTEPSTIASPFSETDIKRIRLHNQGMRPYAGNVSQIADARVVLFGETHTNQAYVLSLAEFIPKNALIATERASDSPLVHEYN